MSGPRTYRNRRDVRKSPTRKPIIPAMAFNNLLTHAWNPGTGNLVLNFAAPMIRLTDDAGDPMPIIALRSDPDGTIEEMEATAFSADGKSVTFNFADVTSGTYITFAMFPAFASLRSPPLGTTAPVFLNFEGTV